MAEIISLNIVSRTSVGKTAVFSPAVVRGIDTKDIISPIRANGGGQAYFSTKIKGIDTNGARNDAQVDYVSSDSLAAIKAKSSDLVLLTVLFRDAVRHINMLGERMIFDRNNFISSLEPDPVSGGTIFNYLEYGNPYPMQYIVQETIAAIVAASAPPSPSTYRVYSALLTQAGNAAPVATVLDNELGAPVVWSRSSAGVYVATCAGAFPIGKTASMPVGDGADLPVIMGHLPDYFLWRVDDNSVELDVSTDTGVASDGLLGGNFVEIRVYN